jgi:uncharacterized protein (TIGR02611 family)
MFDGIKRSWRRLKAGKPGHRFQSQYEANQKRRRPAWIRPLSIAAGTLLLGVGAVALPAPGPGFLVIGLGGALIARESQHAAGALDWVELRLREAWAWLEDAWAAAPWPVRLLAVVVCMATAVALGWLAAVYILSR